MAVATVKFSAGTARRARGPPAMPSGVISPAVEQPAYRKARARAVQQRGVESLPIESSCEKKTDRQSPRRSLRGLLVRHPWRTPRRRASVLSTRQSAGIVRHANTRRFRHSSALFFRPASPVGRLARTHLACRPRICNGASVRIAFDLKYNIRPLGRHCILADIQRTGVPRMPDTLPRSIRRHQDRPAEIPAPREEGTCRTYL